MKYLDNGKIVVKNTKELKQIILDKEIDLALIDIKKSKLKDFGHLFYEVRSIKGDYSRWDTSNIEFFNSCFEGCELRDINIAGWSMKSVKDCNWMFWKAIRFEQKHGKVDSGMNKLLPWIRDNLLDETESLELDEYINSFDNDLYLDQFELDGDKGENNA